MKKNLTMMPPRKGDNIMEISYTEPAMYEAFCLSYLYLS